MTAKSSVAEDAARRLWARACGDATSPEETAAAAALVCVQLCAGLGRWIGSTGYRALLDRALSRVRSEHPALAEIGCLDDAGFLAAARALGAAAVSATVVALVSEIIELLGRIIGMDMAVQLVNQTHLPSPRGVVSTQPHGERDGD